MRPAVIGRAWRRAGVRQARHRRGGRSGRAADAVGPADQGQSGPRLSFPDHDTLIPPPRCRAQLGQP